MRQQRRVNSPLCISSSIVHLVSACLAPRSCFRERIKRRNTTKYIIMSITGELIHGHIRYQDRRDLTRWRLHQKSSIGHLHLPPQHLTRISGRENKRKEALITSAEVGMRKVTRHCAVGRPSRTPLIMLMAQRGQFKTKRLAVASQDSSCSDITSTLTKHQEPRRMAYSSKSEALIIS